MPSTAVIAGGIAAVLICAGLGIGLGVGLTRDDNDSPPAASADEAISQESGAAGGAASPAAIGAPLAAPRGPAAMFPGTAPAAIVPLPDPMLAPIEGPAPAPAPEAPTPAPLEAPLAAPEVAPVPAVSPIVAPGPTAVAVPEEAPEMAPVPVPMDAIEPELMPPAAAPAVTPAPAPAPAPVVTPAPAPAPAPAPVATFQDRIAPGPDGKYPVCVNGDSEEWGEWDIFRPCGVRVFADGRVELAEWYGGFDGFPAVDPADGHETCFNSAVAEMFGVPLCSFEKTTDGFDDYGEEIEAVECQENADGSQCVCAADDKAASLRSQRGWPGNVGIKKFLETVRARAGPTNYDFPDDEEIADNGGRAANVALVQAAFQDMITVSQC